MENNENISTRWRGKLMLDYLPGINYAMNLNGVKACTRCVIENDDSCDWERVRVSLDGEWVSHSEGMVEMIPMGNRVQVEGLQILIDPHRLVEMTEGVTSQFTMTVEMDGHQVHSENFPLELMTFDQWSGTQVMPELLSSFVTPNHPVLSRISVEASKHLEKWTGSSALDDYQTQDRNRARKMVAAVFEALRSESIVYNTVPPSFEKSGQRIRLADKVLGEKLGNCLDLTLLFASCLESIGIFPLVVLMHGHAFVGAWLTEDVYAQNVGDDASFLLKNCADGVNNIVLVESTMLTSSGAVTFDEAVNKAVYALRKEENFEFFIDVHRCRLSGIRPLPQRIEKEGTWVLENEGVEHENATKEVKQLDHYALKFEETDKAISKQTIWERKLLDFSLRNNLLNTKLGKRVIPFISFDIDRLEDLLQDGDSYQAMPCPQEKMQPEGQGMYDSSLQASHLQNLVKEQQKIGKIVSYLTEGELRTALKFLYRTARTSMEENGANSLFMALGLLRWYETDKSVQPRYAPILLLPVDLVRKGGTTGYVIRSRDEEIILNTTLVEMLKQQFKINLDVLNPLPHDDHGVDVKLILSGIRQAIGSMKRWNVLEESLLGLFSFSKFVMWNDIHTNADKLKENQVIATLMEQKLKWQDEGSAVDARKVDREQEPKNFAIPMDVDSSQMEAVIESGEGKSFILHGPPGTGKSQTITNMIANALYQGKRVLFVAEKMAALSVVEKRLRKIGLEPFCLELHSNKVTKSHFLSQLEMALNAKRIQSDENYEKTSAELFEHRQKLIAHMEALHRKQANGFSLYDCISNYLSIKGDELNSGLPDVKEVNADMLKQWSNEIEYFDAVFQITGHPSEHPLNGLEPKDARMENTNKLKELLTDYKWLFDSLLGQIDKALSNVIRTAPTWKDVDRTNQICHLLDGVNQMKATLLGTCSEKILDENPKLWRQELLAIEKKWFLPRFFAMRSFVKKLRTFCPALESGETVTLIDKLDAYKNAEKALRDEVDGESSVMEHTDGKAMKELMDANRKYRDLLQRIEPLAVLRFASNELRISVPQTIDRWLQHYDQVKDWCQWSMQKHKVEDLGLQSAVDYVLDEKKSGTEAANALKRGIFHQLTLGIVDEDDQLRMFNGLLMEDLIARYRQETSNFQELTKKELYCRLASRIPSQTMEAASNSEMGKLKRNINNGGRGTSIRKIIDDIPTLLPKLCPCMLMSPISVAQFIDLNAPKFDIVIFDEASQMPTSEAVGAIARGKSLVVVGDPMQMPPTSFFETSMVDEDEAEFDDMESILDDCITLSIPSKYLTWHYRSKHESLIAFSNVQYYDGKLYTFPSVDDRVSKVSLVQVEGTYDKGHTRSNPAEAQAIVKEVIRRLRDPELSKLSIGIVSFSKVQQNLIEDVLTDELARYPELEAKANNVEEPIFIKNLENVQGDERDVILFSVGYGPDKYGHVSMNFGPLNNEGGERRLNVAVSRSRYEMIIFSTLRAEQIDLRRSQAKGVVGLKKFLEFAERGMSAIPAVNAVHQDQTVLISEIATALEQKGLKVDTMVGKSNFKIDLAILNPQKPDEYLMGLLCDGKNYYETPTTRDREICQPNVMRMLGWNFMRVWAVDWFENRHKVIQRIMESIEQLQKGLPVEEKQMEDKPAQPVIKFNLAAEKEMVEVNPREQVYTKAKLKEFTGEPAIEKVLKNEERVKKQVQEIVSVEQPVTNTYIYKRIASLWKLNRVTPRLQELVDRCLLRMFLDPRSEGKSMTYWTDSKLWQTYSLYRIDSGRDIQDIPTVELMNAAMYAIEQQVSVPRDALKKGVSQLLGFGRKGTAVDAAIDAAINRLIAQGTLEENGENISIAKNNN